MATIETIYGNLYQNTYVYTKNKYNINTVPVPSTHTYRGTVEIPAGITQKGTGNYPLIHAADVQIGNSESDRLNNKLNNYDLILRDLYGRAPSLLESLSDGRDSNVITALEADNGVRGANGTAGIQSLSRVADILNNRTETIDDRLLDLRAIKTISFSLESEAITNPTGNKNSIVADNNGDTITVGPSNKWIKIFSNATNDSFNIGHLVQSITDDTGSTDFNAASVTETFAVDTFTFDEAGHVRSRHKHTYTMPCSFKQVSVGAQSNAVSNDVSSAVGDCIANNLTGILTLYTGNKWINIAANRAGTNTNADDCITFSHALSALEAGAHNSTYTLAAQTPNFGSNFNILIPTISFTTDAAGHVTAYSYSSSNTTVTLPTPSITSSSTDQVVTGITKVTTEGHNNGTFTYSKANIGTFAITGYTLGSNNNALAATDTLNVALGKLQVQINSINSWRINGAAITNNTLLNATTLKMSNETNAETISSAIAAASTAHSSAGYMLSSGFTGTAIMGKISQGDLIKKITGNDNYTTLADLKTALEGV